MSNTPPYPKDMPAIQPAGDSAESGRPQHETSTKVDLREVADAVNAQVVKTPLRCVLIAFGLGTAIGMMFSACGSYRD